MCIQQTLYTVHTIVKGDLNAHPVVSCSTMQILLSITQSEDICFLRTPTVHSRGRQARTCDPRRHFALLSRMRAIRFKTGSLNLKKAMPLWQVIATENMLCSEQSTATGTCTYVSRWRLPAVTCYCYGPANATHVNWASLAHFSIAKLNRFNRAAVLLVRTIRHYTLSNFCHYHYIYVIPLHLIKAYAVSSFSPHLIITVSSYLLFQNAYSCRLRQIIAQCLLPRLEMKSETWSMYLSIILVYINSQNTAYMFWY
jgi:hypothetical protein